MTTMSLVFIIRTPMSPPSKDELDSFNNNDNSESENAMSISVVNGLDTFCFATKLAVYSSSSYVH